MTKFGDNIYVPMWLVPELGADDLYVGIFGNADPLDKTQWLKVNKAFQDSTASFQDRTLTCTGVVTAAHYRFMWTLVGSVKNPQAKIMSVQVDYESSPMQFLDDGVAATQNFPFDVTVNWKFYKIDEKIYSPPAPPIIFSVPYDVFYPFQITGAAGRTLGYNAGFGLILTALASIVIMSLSLS